MGLTKIEKYSKKHLKAAAYAKALGHPARLAIVQELIKNNTCNCGELVLDIGLAQSTISKHLKELKEVGLIKGNIEGNSVCYCIDSKGWKEMKDYFDPMFLKACKEISNC